MIDNRAFRWANFVMAALFILSALVQFNDPDPVWWIVVYGLAAAASLIAPRLPAGFLLSGTAGMVALGWIVAHGPRIAPGVRADHLMLAMEDKTPAIEESRELIGLVVVVVWMVALTVRLGASRSAGAGRPEVSGRPRSGD